MALGIDRATEKAILESILPKMKSLADEIKHDLFAPGNIPVDSGRLLASTSIEVHPDGTIEGKSTESYAEYVHDGTHNADGTTKEAANPYLSRVFYRKRKAR